MIEFKNRKLDLNKPVLVYRCLNRKGFTFSIKQNGLVVAHTDNITLTNVTTIVNKSGKQRAIENKVRNVHAFLKGEIVTEVGDLLGNDLLYNPFTEKGFHGVEDENLTYLKFIQIKNKRIIYVK